MTQEQAIKLAMDGHNIFLTGQAGTGKTYTLNKIINKLSKQGKTIARTASTGIASTFIDGSTVHSWSGVGVKSSLSTDDLYKVKNNPFAKRKIDCVDVLIIDEISMLPDYVFDLVAETCSFIKDKNKFFGGIQVIVCGDFFQLPPVTNNGLPHYCFQSRVFQAMNFKFCYLEKIYRQGNDLEFINLLNAIRNQEIEEKHYSLLNSLQNNTKNIDKAVNLYPHNVNVDIENTRQLNLLPGEAHIIYAETNGVEFIYKRMLKNLLSPNPLILKEGCKIMLTVNKYEMANPYPIFVNGTLGTITKVEPDDEEEGFFYIEIETAKDRDKIVVDKHCWKEKEPQPNGQEKTSASVAHYPIKLAWALTVHKSQGSTLDYVNLDLSEVFTHNMGYVALSRCTTLEGIYLKGYNEKTLEIDPLILRADKEFRKESEKNK